MVEYLREVFMNNERHEPADRWPPDGWILLPPYGDLDSLREAFSPPRKDFDLQEAWQWVDTLILWYRQLKQDRIDLASSVLEGGAQNARLLVEAVRRRWSLFHRMPT